jgi:hypothetical protein
LIFCWSDLMLKSDHKFWHEFDRSLTNIPIELRTKYLSNFLIKYISDPDQFVWSGKSKTKAFFNFFSTFFWTFLWFWDTNFAHELGTAICHGIWDAAPIWEHQFGTFYRTFFMFGLYKKNDRSIIVQRREKIRIL